jgi:hypothetical protein
VLCCESKWRSKDQWRGSCFVNFAAVQLSPFPLWVLLGYYAILVGGWLWHVVFARVWRRAATRSPSAYASKQLT